MNLIKTSTLQIPKNFPKEKIAALSENFENYLSKSFKIVAKFPHHEGNDTLKKNYQILYYLQFKLK